MAWPKKQPVCDLEISWTIFRVKQPVKFWTNHFRIPEFPLVGLGICSQVSNTAGVSQVQTVRENSARQTEPFEDTIRGQNRIIHISSSSWWEQGWEVSLQWTSHSTTSMSEFVHSMSTWCLRILMGNAGKSFSGAMSSFPKENIYRYVMPAGSFWWAGFS